MKAALYKEYGGPEVVRIEEVETPEPGPGEVLVRIRATTVTSGDWRVRSLELPPGMGLFGRPAFGLFKPRNPILGTEFAGDVVAVGEGVTRFSVDDKVFGFPGAQMRSHAEFRTMPEDGRIARMPEGMDYGHAAALSFGGTTALQYLRNKGGIKAGERVLIVGASGGVGTAAVQLAKHFGAHVTGVCSGKNVELVKSLGADEVIDYTVDDFREAGEQWDIIMDNVGLVRGSDRKLLKPGGRLLLVLAGMGMTLSVPFRNMFSDKRFVAGPVAEEPADIELLSELAGAGDFTSVIDRSYAFEEIQKAHAHVDTGRKVGNVVVLID